MSDSASIRSLYRGYLRAIRQLPHIYLRQFYRLKVRDDIENIRDTKLPSLRKRKHSRIAKELRRMNRGLQGDWRSFDHVLDIAYGRKGKLKHELLEPFISDTNSSVAPPIIPQMSNSRPPVYSPGFLALLKSDISRNPRGLRPAALTQSSILPPEGEPSSEEARLWGVLSKRRQKNILNKFFKEQVQKVYPPIGVEFKHGKSLEGILPKGAFEQGSKLRKDVEAIVGPLWKAPRLTRRERRALGPDISHPESLSEPGHPSRWLRRRYQSLLSRLPILQLTPGQKSDIAKYTVVRSGKALGDMYSTGGRLLPVAADAQLAWHDLSAAQSKGRKLSAER